MKKLIEHIEHIKGKPHHIRKRVAFGVATGVTGLIAVVWLAANLSAGAFAIQGASFAQSTAPQGNAVVKVDNNGDQGLAGAAAAVQGADAPAHIEIVDTSTSTPVAQPDPTILPF